MNELTTKQKLSELLQNCGPVISANNLIEIFSITNIAASQLLARWKKQGWVERIKQGIYIILPIEIDANLHSIEDPYILIPKLFGKNSYIGGYSAAAYWGLTEQIFCDICVVVTQPIKRKINKITNINFILTKISYNHSYGTKIIIRNEEQILISDPTKTIIDMLATPTIGGGINHVAECFHTYLFSKYFDHDLLIKYASNYSNNAIFKRMGYLSSIILGQDNQISIECTKHLSKGNAQLDPANKGKTLITKWKLFIPFNFNINIDNKIR